MVRFILNIILLVCFPVLPMKGASRDNSSDSLMNQLDNVISQRETYIQQKIAKLTRLRHQADVTRDLNARFDVLGDLLDEYISFNTDSAYTICIQREQIAQALQDPVLLMNARMNRASILNATAMYKESLDIMDSIELETLPEYLHPYYFHIKRTVYGGLADYSAFSSERERYDRLTDMYRDSLLSVNAPTSLTYAIIKADQLNVCGRPKEAIELLKRHITDNELSNHDKAICAYSLAMSYSIIGDTDNQKRELLKSSIYDIKSAVREYISLRQLALLLYQEGDLERAYKFISIAVDDAAKCNARQRIVELNLFYPMINAIYVDKIQSQKSYLSKTIVIITVLSLVLLLLLVYTRKQMKKVAEARKTIQSAYEQVNNLNAELQETIEKLHKANNDIAEISELKEVYIGQYMNQCLEYIDKLDTYRKSLGRLVNFGKIEELKKALHSTSATEDEFKEFYDQFDKTFLALFPSFVEDFNKLLLPEEAVIPKKEGCLNTELRIFALIRLGITDSDQIAKFLRYSLTTIYNYRTKVRNKAKGDRNLLEQEIIKIGRH